MWMMEMYGVGSEAMLSEASLKYLFPHCVDTRRHDGSADVLFFLLFLGSSG